ARDGYPVSYLVLALRFLTILPVPGEEAQGPGALGRAAWWFPVVGLALGTGLVLADRVFLIVFPPLLAAVLLVAVWKILTGCRHPRRGIRGRLSRWTLPVGNARVRGRPLDAVGDHARLVGRARPEPRPRLRAALGRLSRVAGGRPHRRRAGGRGGDRRDGDAARGGGVHSRAPDLSADHHLSRPARQRGGSGDAALHRA